VCLNLILLSATFTIEGGREAKTALHVSLDSRRSFVINGVTVASTLLSVPTTINAIDIKVTPLAHTFVTKDDAAKPVRKNDFTRFLTNVNVVLLFSSWDRDGEEEVVKLTKERKVGRGPGGNIVILAKKVS